MKKFVFLLLAVVFSICSYAGQSNNSNYINGATVAPSATFQTYANSYGSYPSPPNFTDVKIDNIVGVMIDHSSNVYVGTKLDYTFNLQIVSYDPSLSSSVQNISLDIQYDPNKLTHYKDKHLFSYSGYVRMDVQITSIIDNSTGSPVTNPEDIFKVESQINIERYYNFTYASAPGSFLITPVTNSGIYEYQVSWGAMVGAEEYDLEWTWVNDYTATYGAYSITGKEYDFKHNSTRVRVSETQYSVTNTFDHGVLIFRVRGIGRNPSDWSKLVFGAWSVVNDQDLVSSVSSTYKVSVTTHEDQINWQYSSSYAEEGKKKEVVSYFDGSLRTRQMVTKSNTNNEVIVGESYYDHQGRKAVDALPVPTPDQNPQIQYFENFNVNTSLDAYSRADFDIDQSACLTPTNPFDDSDGAGNYYSTSNTYNALPSDEEFNAFLPISYGYPFIRTEFTPDNTGRVRRQGGVGLTHQLGTDHETKYYYGKPLQYELDRLFGNEAGYSRFYKKDMVIDPNGQVSISFTDLAGKVVATGLAGDAPDNVDALGSQSGAAVNVVADLFEKDASGHSETNRFLYEDGAIVYNSTFLASEQGTYDFKYEVIAPAYTNGCLNGDLCFDCTYDLVVRITDDCGTILAERTEYVGGAQLDMSCENPLISYSTTADPISLSLDVGNYHVYKELRVNQQDMDYYMSELMNPGNSCFKTEEDFINEELALVNTEGCEITCQECVDGLGTRDEFVLRGLGTEEEWEVAYKNCTEPCATESKCQSFYRLMLSDVSPGGQYAEWYNTSTGRMSPAQYPLSLFNINNYLPDIAGNNAYWRNPSHADKGAGYYNEDGTRAKILITELPSGEYFPKVNSSFIGSDGKRYAYPENLTNTEDFILFWKNDWATSLVQYHPEYCYFEWCDVNDEPNLSEMSSEKFDNLLAEADSKSDAVDLNIFSYPGNETLILDGDPYFAAGGRGASQYGDMQTILQSGDFTGTGYSIFELAGVMAKCPGTFTLSGAPASGCTDFGVTTDPTEMNAEWVAFRSLYLGEKQKLQGKEAHAYVKANCSKRGVNGCIGNTDFNPLVYGITGSESPSYLGNADMVCGDDHAGLYLSKQKRFITPVDMNNSSESEAAFNLYYNTGQCPEAIYLQTFINGVNTEGNLFNTFNLMHKPYFNRDLYAKINDLNGGIASSYTDYTYTPTLSGQKLTIQFEDQNTSTFSDCEIELTLAVPYSWSNLTSLSNIVDDPTNSDPLVFIFTAMIDDDGDPQTPDKEVQGSGRSCFAVSGCSFKTNCPPSAFAKDLVVLMNTLLASSGSDLFSSGVDLEVAPYDARMSDEIKGYMAPIVDQRKWRYNGGSKFYLYSTNGSTTNEVEIQFLAYEDPSGSFNSGNLSQITLFESIQPDPQTAHGFFITAYYDDGSGMIRPVTIKGIINFTVGTFNNLWINGECGGYTPSLCKSTEHKTKDALEPFLEHIVNNPPGSPTLLSGITQWTSLLQDQLGMGSYKIQQTGIEFNTITYNITSEEFTPGSPESICEIKLYRIDPYYTNRYDFADIIALREIEVDQDLLIDGKAYSFTVLAEYTNGVTERIAGYTSCLPVKDCGCAGRPTISEGGNGCRGAYDIYLSVVEKFNQNFFGNNPTPVTLTPIAEVDFNCTCAGAYLEYLETYSGGGTPLDFDEYCINEECNVKFSQLEEAVAAWNSANPNASPALTATGQAGEGCECFDKYIQYLRGYNQSGTPMDFASWEGAGLCIDDDDCAGMKELYSVEVLRFNGHNGSVIMDGPSPNVEDNRPPNNQLLRNPDGHVLEIEDISDSDCECLRAYINYLKSIDLDPGDPAPMSFSAFNGAGYCSSGSLLMLPEDGLEYAQINNDHLADPYKECLKGNDLLKSDKASNYSIQPFEIKNALASFSVLSWSSPVEMGELKKDKMDLRGSNDPSKELDIYSLTKAQIECIEAIKAKCTSQVSDTKEEDGLEQGEGKAAKTGALHLTSKNYYGVEESSLYEPTYYSVEPCMTFSFVSPTVEYTSKCEEHLNNVATLTGQTRYQDYLKEFLAEQADDYRRHCMDAAQELFELDYQDRTYHYTLYYYDQAQNLVRTVPPGGVNLVTQSTDFDQIIEDRANKSRKYFTEHQLITKYEYNSLNQLTKQSVPDHDLMDRWYVNSSNPSSDLPSNFEARASYTVDASRIIIAGSIGGEDYLFQSDDAGINWYRVGDIQAGTLKAMHMATASVGYAVGEEGLLYKTLDGGQSWRMIPSSVGVVSDLTTVYFKDANNGIVAGDNGQVWLTTNGGISWTASSTVINGDITAIAAFSTTDLIMSVNLSGRGLIYKSSNFGTNWTLMQNFRPDNLADIHMISSSEGYAGGKNGVLLYTANSGVSWQVVANNLDKDIRKLYFKDVNKGFAILNDKSIGGNIYYTEDAGITWTQASTIGEYRDFNFYSTTAGYAVGNKSGVGILAKLDIDAGTVAKLADLSGISTELYAVHFIDQNTGAIAGDNGAVYTTTNATSPFLSWVTLSLGGYATEDIRDIYFNTVTKGALVTDNGLLLTYNAGSVTNNNVASENYVNIKYGSGQVFAVDNNGYGTIKQSAATSLTGYTALHTYNSGNNPNTSSLKAVSPTSASTVYAVGEQGLILQDATLQENKAWMASIHALAAINGGSQALAVGEDGGVWQSSNGGVNWNLLSIASSEDLNTVSMANSTTGMVAGDKGVLYTYSSGNMSAANSGIAQDIYALDHLSSSAIAMAADEGLIRVSSNGGVSWQSAGANTLASNSGVYAIEYISASDILAVGGLGYTWSSDGSVLSRVEDIRLPIIHDLHFADRQYGVMASEEGGLFISDNGGKSWKLKTSLNGLALQSAWRPDAQTILVSDDQNRIQRSSSTGAIFSVTHSGSQQINDIAFESNKLNGVAVGNAGELLYTSDGGASWTAGTPGSSMTDNLNAVTMINDRAFAAGDAGAMLTTDDAGVSWTVQAQPTSNDLYGIYFHDYLTGYVVGRNGDFYKTNDGGVLWASKQNNNAGQPASGDDLYTITFTSRFDGYFAGTNYAKRLTDEADLFSGFMYYDALGRLTVSENTRQFNKANYVYSYMLFDDLGRITEAGEIASVTDVRDLYENRLVEEQDFITWVNAGTRTEVVQTYYDMVLSDPGSGALSISGFTQDNLRKRVSSVTYSETLDNDHLTYTNAIHYTYDIHGSVYSFIQDNPKLTSIGRQYVRVDYTYDLVSKKVNQVDYQKGKEDQWLQHFSNDADNRIISVETSSDGVIWDKDATYEYYRHGPLARFELGDEKVQGIDYAYTLHGCIKGVNSNTLSINEDMGRDGGSYAPHQSIARDAFGYTLGYYNGDYAPVNGLSAGPGLFVPSTTGSDLEAHRNNLYNGNISHMVTSIVDPNTDQVLPQGYAYKYDQLNRIADMRAFSNFNMANNQFLSGSGTPVPYAEDFDYDAMGNIINLKRKGEPGNTAMDDLQYKYDWVNNDPNQGLRSNRLYHVDDLTSSSYTDDIDDQGTFTPGSSSIDVNAVNNYSYDELGNVVKDLAEEIESMTYTRDGKLSNIVRIPSSMKPDIELNYDPYGRLVSKVIKPKPLNTNTEYTEWYELSASGNRLITYKELVDPNSGGHIFILNEQIIFGTKRLGMTICNDTITGDTSFQAYNSRIKGLKKYEGTNHLGNVLAVISDKRIPHDDNLDNVIDYYTADIRGSYDYYSFGSPMPGRTFVTQACSTQTSQSTVYSYLEDFNTGNFWPAYNAAATTADPLNSRMRVDVYGPNSGTQNTIPCLPGVSNQLDILLQFGLNPTIQIELYDPSTMTLISPPVPVNGVPGLVMPISLNFTGPVSGNVVVRIVDIGGAYPDAFYVGYVNVSGQQTITSQICWEEDYRFGFNGKEKNNEMKGMGNSVNFGSRYQDSRLGRWFNVDSYKEIYSAFSPYAFGVNNPLNNIDKDGNTIVPYDEYSKQQMGKHFERLFDKETATLLTNHLSLDGTYNPISRKDFRKAIRGMSSDQKALARGYYKMINSDKKALIVFQNDDEVIPDEALLTTKSQVYSGAKMGDLMKASGGGATFNADGTVNSEYSTAILMNPEADVSDAEVDVLDEDGNSGTFSKPNKGKGVTIDEIIAHETLGHGFFGGFLGKKVLEQAVYSIQISNIVRRMKGAVPRSGLKDHDVSHKESKVGSKVLKPKVDVNAVPEELKKE